MIDVRARQPRRVNGVESSDLSGMPSGLRRVEDEFAPIADDVANPLGRLADREIAARAQVDRRLRLVVFAQDEEAGVGQIVGEDEFPTRRAGSPDRHGRLRFDLGPVHFADQSAGSRVRLRA